MAAIDHLQVLRELVDLRISHTRHVIEDEGVAPSAREYAFEASGGRNLLLYLDALESLGEKLQPERLGELSPEDLTVAERVVSFSISNRNPPYVGGLGTGSRRLMEQISARTDREHYRAAGEWLQNEAARPILEPLESQPAVVGERLPEAPTLER